MNNIDATYAITATIERGGMPCSRKDAVKAGNQIMKTIIKKNGDKKKDYRYALVEATLGDEKYLVFAAQTPQGGYITLRWTDIKDSQTYLPRTIMAECGGPDGIELIPIMGTVSDATIVPKEWEQVCRVGEPETKH